MKKALITGGTGAIGAALVKKFSKEYETYFIYKENELKAAELSAEFGAHGYKCDLENTREIADTIAKIGAVDILVNNAGISQIKLFTDITDEDWRKMMSVDLDAVFFVTRAVLPSMIAKKSGAIVNISSMWGIAGASCEVHYSAAKAGIIGMTKALAKETGPSGVTVNCVAPGVIDSPMNSHLTVDELAQLAEETPLTRLGTAEEVADAVFFMANARFITGQVLSVDGGFIL